MTRTRSRSTARRVADLTLDVAVGGTALAADKALETFDRITDRAGSVLRRTRRQARQRSEQLREQADEAYERAEHVAERAHRAAGGQDHRPYEERTREELYELAAERHVEGRSHMTKENLITALRAEPAAERARRAAGGQDHRPYEERTREELYELAAERHVEGRSQMTKDELIAALRAQH